MALREGVALMIAREKELEMLREYIKTNGVTQLPPDQRTEEDLMRVPDKKKKKKRTLRSVKKNK